MGSLVDSSDRLSRAFGALADPTRRAILSRLALGDASVAELAEPFDMTIRAVSKHVRVLERAELVDRRKDGQRRPSSIRPAPLREAYSWLQDYRRLWEARFDRMDAMLDNIKKEGSTNECT